MPLKGIQIGDEEIELGRARIGDRSAVIDFRGEPASKSNHRQRLELGERLGRSDDDRRLSALNRTVELDDGEVGGE